ncbi:hypothetical protein AAG570_012153 [Ranatra chinensis]|uniref:OCIA domain-containing protein n=1 Tax=Ranatra chinensis TaxID=642074 RepID=A0ABD0YWG1_9HEMI
MGIGTYYGVKGGLLQPNNRYGAIPKVIGSVVLGYIIGKVSYQGKCAEKLMALPDSKLGAMLRNRRRKGGFQESLTMDDASGIGKAIGSMPESEVFSDLPKGTSSPMDLDTDRPLSGGLDDSFRPTLDDIQIDSFEQLPPPSSRTTTYEELRRKNREEYEMKKTKPYRGVLTPDEVPSALHAKDARPEPPAPDVWNRPKNKYGDIWDK